MAHLIRKGESYLVRFCYARRTYKRSLSTTEFEAADAGLAIVKLALYRMRTGQLQVPEGVDVGDFIVSGGKLAPKNPAVLFATSLNSLRRQYANQLAHLAESNRNTIAIHLANLAKQLGAKADAPLDQICRRDLENFLQARLNQRAAATVAKERHTIVGFFQWAVTQGAISTCPADDLTRIKSSGDAAAFRTIAQIEDTLARGGLSQTEQWAQWDCVFLAPAEIAELLKLVKQRAVQPESYLLHAIPAYTGMRRGEVLRLRWSDIEFAQSTLSARSRKQSRQKAETVRRIAMHRELREILFEWQRARPRGQFVLSDERDLEPLTEYEANRRFWRPLRGTAWCLASRKHRFKIGFHTYRHSFASNLAAAGIDQRIIDEMMGHQTEAMRKRYRHLAPSLQNAAMQAFSFHST